MSAGPPGAGRSSTMSGNGKRSLTPIAPLGSSRFHCETPADVGVERLYNLARFQGVIRNRRVKRRAGSIQSLQSVLRRRISIASDAQAASPPRILAHSLCPSSNEQAAQTPGRPVPAGMRGWISRARGRDDPVASACIHRARGRRSLVPAWPRSTARELPPRRRIRSRSNRS
jgi:hypothetical protein